ncbi:MAG: histidinol-phosphatase HisJ [Desulfobacteraceae bacterium]|nr:MAG: histidinol-phosphatase HisJ [Desulfobacteraceae bacterium]
MNIDTRSDYHMHTLFSDGSATIDEMARAAISSGLTQITFTDHMPLPFDTRYAMKKEEVDQYRLAVREARAKYDGRLVINMGIEIEYIPSLRFWIKSIAQMGWDVLIASVHSLQVGDESGMVNGTYEEFERLYRMFDYDIKSLYRNYYQTLQTAYRTGCFDIAGHLDVLKKHNVGQPFFDENDPDYIAAVQETLEVIKKQEMSMEINTGGFNHPVGEQYPSRWIIREASQMGIPLVLSSDSHSPRTLRHNFDRMELLVGVEPAF